MSQPPTDINRRILIVDDTPSIHEDFRKILDAGSCTHDALGETEHALFGAPPTAPAQHFDLDSAFQGEQALAKVEAALNAQAPYAMAFIDMRMPPGWDGLQTIARLWQVDPKLQVALCTAYSDYSWEDIAGQLDLGDRLLILKKPFDAIEIRQMANALTVKWQMTEQAALKAERLEQAVEARTRELADANIIVQNSPTILYRLRGEPPFALMYISHNITKFGHSAARLVGAADWASTLVHADDQGKLDEAMARVLDRDAAAASIEFRLRTADDTLRWVENRYIPVRNAQGQLVEIEGIILDITERRLAEEKFALMARTDGLTGLANRAMLIERLHQAFAAARRGATPFAMFYLDLDHFKRVNDTLGHPVGDLLLQEVARRLSACTRENDVVARLGGDEFAILQLDVDEPTRCAALASKVCDALAQPYYLDNNAVRLSSSIGISLYTSQCLSADGLLAQSDMALYRAKEKGRNQFQFHSEEITREVGERVTLANDLKHALEHDELQLQFLPEIDLGSGKVLGMAARVRWLHPERGWLAPEVFMPAAEKTGVSIALGHWLLDQACRQMRQWHDQGIAPPLIAMEVSLTQLKSGADLIYDVLRTTARWNICPWELRFDVTEATLAQTKWTHNDILPRLCQLGVKIAIDNFGSEYSSFDYLKTYRVNHLKLAPQLLDCASNDPDCAQTLRAIINFARDVGIGIIADRHELSQPHDLLGGDAAQPISHAFSRSLDSAQALELLKLDSMPLPQVRR